MPLLRFKVAVIQFRALTGRNERNGAEAARLLERAGKAGARLVVLPELCVPGYNFRTVKEARNSSEDVPGGPTTRSWEVVAKQFGMYIVGGVCEMSDEGLHNSAVLIGPEGYLGAYRKLHLWDKEKLWFVPGDSLQVYETSLGRLGLMICYDNYFPEVARGLAGLGAEVICHPTATEDPFDMDINRVRSVENGVYIASANLVGSERKVRFVGRSQVTGPRGRVACSLAGAAEGVAFATFDRKGLVRARRIGNANSVLSDRRPDVYSSPVLIRHRR